jgi:hypothetical protein
MVHQDEQEKPVNFLLTCMQVFLRSVSLQFV